MSEEQHKRASLRGLGRRIFFGEEAPAEPAYSEAGLSGEFRLSPEEETDILELLSPPLGLMIAGQAPSLRPEEAPPALSLSARPTEPVMASPDSFPEPDFSDEEDFYAIGTSVPAAPMPEFFAEAAPVDSFAPSLEAMDMEGESDFAEPPLLADEALFDEDFVLETDDSYLDWMQTEDFVEDSGAPVAQFVEEPPIHAGELESYPVEPAWMLDPGFIDAEEEQASAGDYVPLPEPEFDDLALAEGVPEDLPPITEVWDIAEASDVPLETDTTVPFPISTIESEVIERGESREAIPRYEVEAPPAHPIDLAAANRLLPEATAALIPPDGENLSDEEVPAEFIAEVDAQDYSSTEETALSDPTRPLELPPPDVSAAVEDIPAIEAIHWHESEEPENYSVNLAGLNRVVQGLSAVLIPHDPELATDPRSTAQVDIETLPPIEEATPPYGINLRDSSRPLTPSLSQLVPEEPEEEGGAIFTPAEVISSVGETISEAVEDISPIARPVAPRAPAEQLFRRTIQADTSLLEQFVDDERLRELWDMIEAVQEDLVEYPSADRRATDVYQQELLKASGLLLQARENYDDARAIVYRIRADLNRERKVQADIVRYRPWILNYIIGWGIALVVLALLNGAVENITDTLEVPFFANAYLPTIAGAFGGLFIGYTTLNKHTSIRRDFDPIHLPWYLFSPFVGGLMGFLTFLFAAVTIEATVNADLTSSDALSGGGIFLWILIAFLAGMNQNVVVNMFRNRNRGDQRKDNP